MSGYITVDDLAFERRISLRDAYLVMQHFISAHVERGEVRTGDLLAYFALATDRRGGDPAALYDYLEAVAAVLGPEERATEPAASTTPPAA
jgi:hypothetical protein